MGRKTYDPSLRKTAERMRAEGKTYREIKDVVGVCKSTLSVWLGKKFPGIFDKRAQRMHLAHIRPSAIVAKRRRKENRQIELAKQVKKELKDYPLRDMGLYKSVLSALYWAEGAKYEGACGPHFANTDPLLSKFYITLLRKCYKINETKFRIRLHLHYYHPIKKTKKFWSDLLQVPLQQFNSTYIKKRSRRKRFRKNFMGICFITYLDSSIRRDIMEIAHQLAEYTTV